ncbi:MAG: hypothetical protein H6R27_1131 [Proteobacteria bacterium]|nr:hypothetical protein [Pseudomonadota bacterium]
MSFALLLAAAAAIFALLWFGERTGDQPVKWILKPVASALFIVAALWQGPQSRYDWLVVAGLVLSAAGDIALIPRDRRAFLGGLVAFLMAHVAYTLAFAGRADLLALPPGYLLVIGLASLALYLYFRPHLGRMQAPVAAYVVVITVMLAAAWAVAADSPGAFGWQVAAGATLFYLSDVTVARSRFVPGAGFANRAIGLPLYYAAQFLLALSI